MNVEIPTQIEVSLKVYRSQSSWLQFFYVLLGGISIIAPLSVASFTDLLGDLWTRVFSFSGALSIGLVGGFRLQQQSNKMRRAYLELRSAILRYQSTTTFTIDDLVSEYVRIAETIGDIIGPQAEDLRRGLQE